MPGYQAYPSTSKPVEPDKGEAPPSVMKAVKLMYAGAAISLVALIISVAVPLAETATVKNQIRKDHPKFNASQVNQFFEQNIIVYAVQGVIIVALWVWMARANRQGKNWARITSSVLFALATVQLFLSLGSSSLFGLIFAALTWLAGLGTIFFLWRRESSEFFKPRQLV